MQLIKACKGFFVAIFKLRPDFTIIGLFPSHVSAVSAFGNRRNLNVSIKLNKINVNMILRKNGCQFRSGCAGNLNF